MESGSKMIEALSVACRNDPADLPSGKSAGGGGSTAQQSHDRVGLLVGLCKHRHARLLQDLRFCQRRRFRRVVGVLDAAA